MAVGSVAVVVHSLTMFFSSPATTTASSIAKLEPTPEKDNDNISKKTTPLQIQDRRFSHLSLPSLEVDCLAALLLRHHNPFQPPESSL